MQPKVRAAEESGRFDLQFCACVRVCVCVRACVCVYSSYSGQVEYYHSYQIILNFMAFYIF